jgi:peptide/nickel transport system permease protein
MSAPGTTVTVSGARALEAAQQPSYNRLLRRLSTALRANAVVVASLVFIVGITLLAVFVPFLPLPDPTSQSVLFRLQPPSPEHWMGTDRLGRDILSRLLWGARVSLVVGVGVVVLSTVLGTLLGVLSGYFRGWLSEVLLRVIDILLAFPPLILAMVTVTVLGPSLVTVVLAISVGSIPRFARVARGTILSIRDRDYVEAARALGTPTWSIVTRHVLLNAVDPLIVFCTLLIPQAILTEALLSFLGLGITEPQPTWGNMINSGQIVLREAPWLTFFPGAAIVLTVLAFNLLGDAIRDALDPSVRDLGAAGASLDATLPRQANARAAQPVRVGAG